MKTVSGALFIKLLFINHKSTVICNHAQHSVLNGMIETLETFVDQQQVDDLTTHGCWCSRLDPQNTQNHAGSSKPVDEIDAICHRWLQSRRCLTLEGGSCEETAKEEVWDSQGWHGAQCVKQPKKSTI